MNNATKDSIDLNATPRQNQHGVFNRKDAVLIVCLIVVAIGSTLPFFYAAQGRLPQAGDLIVHWPRMLMFDETLRSGVWYPRWLGGMNYGYGAATTMFYAPFVYYALSAAHALLGDWLGSLESVVMLAAIGSVTTSYFYARSLLSRASSAVAALLYLLLPYHLIDLYHRGALAELIAFVWMPLVLQMFGASVKRMRGSNIVFGAIGYGLLLVTHPPVAYAFSISFVIFAAVLAISLRSWKPALSACLIVTLGASLSAFYWLPAIIEVRYANQSITNLFDTNRGYVTNLLVGSAFEKLIAAIFIATGILFLFFSWLARSETSPSRKRSILYHHVNGWIVVGAVSLFMILPIADPLARILPGVSGMAFVWRWLAIASLATSFLSGAAVERLLALNQPAMGKDAVTAERANSNRLRIWKLLTVVLTAGAVVFGAIACACASNLKLQFVAPADCIEQDFTPAGAPSVYDLPREGSLRMMSDSPFNQARLIEWKPQERVIEITTRTSDTLRVNSFMFPGWEAFADGVATPIRTDEQLKVMLLDAEPGNRTIKLVFANTPARSFAEWLSLMASSCCALIMLIEFLIRTRNRVIGI